jgi:hypothetical protein
MPGEIENHPRRTSHCSVTHPERSAHEGDHQKAWSHAIDQQPNGKDNNVHLTCFPTRILP